MIKKSVYTAFFVLIATVIILSKSGTTGTLPLTVDIIALNDSSCLLSKAGEVYCWDASVSGALQKSSLKPVYLGEKLKAKSIYGHSGDNNYFNTGNHACALLSDNTVRCWGDISEDSLLDVQAALDIKNAFTQKGKITSYALNPVLQKKAGKIKKVLTTHSAVCVINDKDILYCPQSHLAKFNGFSGIKQAVFGEILSCIQYTDNEVECYDMRGTANSTPIFMKLAGESRPSLFDFRYVYAAGVAYINKQGQALYWEGELPQWEQFPGMYHLPAKPLALGKHKASAVYLSETTACLQLDNGSATCWGQKIKPQGKQAFIKAPGETVGFKDKGKVTDIALGASQNCFLLSSGVIECFVR